MENISCMRVKCFKYLDGFLTGIEETYTDKNDKSFRISRSARNKLSFTITFAGEKLVRTAKEIIDHKYLIK